MRIGAITILVAFVLSGCNTVGGAISGVGKDIQAASEYFNKSK